MSNELASAYLTISAMQENVRRLFKVPSKLEDLRLVNSQQHRVMHAAFGVAGEAGEIIDAVKKWWIYGKPLDQENLVEEIGDALFYLTAMCQALDVTLEEAMQRNIEKLRLRYPSGAYSDRDAIERKDKASE